MGLLVNRFMKRKIGVDRYELESNLSALLLQRGVVSQAEEEGSKHAMTRCGVAEPTYLELDSLQ